MPSVPDSFVDISGFKILRKDTSSLRAKHGVCFYIRNDILVDLADFDVPNAIAVFLVSFGVYVVCVYRPPSGEFSDSVRLASSLLDFCVGREVVILGDFNLPSIDWSIDGAGFGQYDCVSQLFVDVFLQLGAVQWVSEPTFRSGSFLDLILTTEVDRVGQVAVHPPFPHCGHSPVVLDYTFSTNTSNINSNFKKRAWWHGKYKIIDRHLSMIDWQFEFQHLSLSEMYGRFQELVGSLVDLYVPLRTIRNDGPYICKPPSCLKKKREVAWNEYKTLRREFGRSSTVAVESLARYDFINLEYRNFHISSQINYERSLIDRFAESSKFFHAYLYKEKESWCAYCWSNPTLRWIFDW